jgi:hypothetical protein
MCAIAASVIGEKKEMGANMAFLLGILLGLIGLLIVAMGADKSSGSVREKNDQSNNQIDELKSPTNIHKNRKDNESGIADELKKWHDLKILGAITEIEFEEKKRQLLKIE